MELSPLISMSEVVGLVIGIVGFLFVVAWVLRLSTVNESMTHISIEKVDNHLTWIKYGAVLCFSFAVVLWFRSWLIAGVLVGLYLVVGKKLRRFV